MTMSGSRKLRRVFVAGRRRLRPRAGFASSCPDFDSVVEDLREQVDHVD
jgi:hypothetical protein